MYGYVGVYIGSTPYSLDPKLQVHSSSCIYGTARSQNFRLVDILYNEECHRHSIERLAAVRQGSAVHAPSARFE